MSNLFSLTSGQISSREDFVNSWLQEMPMGIPPSNLYPVLLQNIKELMNYGMNPEKVKTGLYRIVGQQLVYYWYGEADDDIIIGTEMYRSPQALTVNITAKNPAHKNHGPYASDLYLDILHTGGTPLRLMSDESLSDEGLKIWKRLLSQKCNIIVYDKNNPGQSKRVITSEKDLLQHFKHGDPTFKRFQYVLTVSGNMLAETVGVFNTRRYRELAGIL